MCNTRQVEVNVNSKWWLIVTTYFSIILGLFFLVDYERLGRINNSGNDLYHPPKRIRSHRVTKVNKTSNSSAGMDVLPAWLADLAVKDLPGAISQAKLLSGELKESSLKAVLLYAIKVDPDLVARELAVYQMSSFSMDEIEMRLANEWYDPEKALKWADQTVTGEKRAMIVGAVLARLVNSSSGHALAYIESMPPGSVRDQAFVIMMNGWAKSDLAAAVRYCETISNDKEGAMAMLGVADEWMVKDMQGVVEYLRNANDNIWLQKLANTAVSHRMQNEDPLTVMEWARSLPSVIRKGASDRVITTWTAKDPAAVASYLEGCDNSIRIQISSTFAKSWAAYDPVAAANWVSSCREWTGKGASVEEVMKSWLNSSPNEACRWLGTLPEGTVRDAGILVLLRREVSADPASVFPWAELLSNPIQREVEEKIIMSYAEADLLQENAEQRK